MCIYLLYHIFCLHKENRVNAVWEYIGVKISTCLNAYETCLCIGSVDYVSIAIQPNNLYIRLHGFHVCS